MPTISLLKHGFFKQSPQRNLETSLFAEDEFNINQLKAEFFTLYKIFVANKSLLDKENQIVLCLGQVCDLLVQYYQVDYVSEDLRTFLDKKKEIDRFIDQGYLPDIHDSPHGFSTFISDRLRANILEFIYVFKSSSKFRRFVSSLITNRSYWNYSRALANCIVVYLLNSQFVELIREINSKIGLGSSPEDVMKALETAQVVLRVLSFSLYAIRFIANLIILIKHVIHAANSEELSAKKVLLQELEKRFYLMFNDLAWGIVNFLSNYHQFFDISQATISQINLAFLAFDILLFFASWYVEARKYHHCLQELVLQKDNEVSSLELAVINRQIDILNDEWNAQCAYYKFNIAAAVLLIFAFAASLLCTAAIALIVLTALSMLGNALYNSCNEYKNYQLACIAIDRELENGRLFEDEYHYGLLEELDLECKEASRIFWNTLIFNAGFTAFVITTAAISWPVAVALTATYLVYKLWDAFEKSQHENNKLRASQKVYRLFNTPVERAELTGSEQENFNSNSLLST
ncbi:hypothetical protein BN59_03312 [Legionella massiliensis]|uniref:Coiled-coil protein n=1 Tax=Legionella massiliensis TaxID=1034943 RepID=A0A078L193_9GAMM|nr:hypothetical protein [Legionella massiliensis]CDZ78997.1 hypothetical protein BN59_03312 [Legionella massiliensis]CEE14735.1 hypothetical protein BN1094_03312 [Legionella massiliensis]